MDIICNVDITTNNPRKNLFWKKLKKKSLNKVLRIATNSTKRTHSVLL